VIRPGASAPSVYTKNMISFNTARIAADATHHAQGTAQRVLKLWAANKRIVRAGHGELLCRPVGNAIELRNSARNGDLLQRKYDRGED
jgi:hypothetical protein